MTTVGYGEIFPVTIYGRMFTILASIIGTFVMSLVIVTLTNLIELSNEEEEAYNILCQTMDTRDRFKIEAVEFIQIWTRYLYVTNRPMPIKVKLKYRIELLLMKNRFKYKRLSVSHSDLQIGDAIEELNEKLELFFKNSRQKFSVFKTNVTQRCGHLRDLQCRIDTLCVRSYDTVQRICSFMKSADELVHLKKYSEVDDLVGVKIDMTKKVHQREVRGENVKTSDFWIKQMLNSKKDMVEFYDSVADKSAFKDMMDNKALCLVKK
jgi:hypothetical protein